MKKLFAIMMAMLIGLSAYCQEKTTVCYAVSPKMNCQNCVNRVKGIIGVMEGVDTVAPDLATQTVTVVYDAAKLKPETIITGMAEAGYTLTPATQAVSPMVSQEARQARTTAVAGASTTAGNQPHQCQGTCGGQGGCQKQVQGACQKQVQGQCTKTGKQCPNAKKEAAQKK